jgi:hypothetical protein
MDVDVENGKRRHRRIVGENSAHCGENTQAVFHIPPNLQSAVKIYQT